MNKQLTRIVAAIVDTRQLTLYRPCGTTLVYHQGDPRFATILESVVPQLTDNGYADVYLPADNVNAYRAFEEKTGGLVRLFRVAKSALKGLFAGPTEPFTVGTVPSKEDKQAEAIASIMSHAVAVTADHFTDVGLNTQSDIVDAGGHTDGKHTPSDATETLVAVIDGNIIPGVEKIKNQFTRASAMNSTEGMEKFLGRLGSVIHDREHSVEDLLKFMERGDLPVTDDGSILIYKVLSRKGVNYVDCHTKRVQQWVGAFVCMDPSLVDHDRTNECSNGLHVARRGYVKEFSGDVCVLAKLAPEDVIAVPNYDANKMRVCGYHIIAELGVAEYANLRKNKAITETEAGKKLLADALAGNHIGRTHEVRITGQNGKGVVVTELVSTKPVEAKSTEPVEALKDTGNEALAAPVDPKEVVKALAQSSSEALSYRQQIYALLPVKTKADALKVLAIKKQAKKGWYALGVTEDVGSHINILAGK